MIRLLRLLRLLNVLVLVDIGIVPIQTLLDDLEKSFGVGASVAANEPIVSLGTIIVVV